MRVRSSKRFRQKNRKFYEYDQRNFKNMYFKKLPLALTSCLCLIGQSRPLQLDHFVRDVVQQNPSLPAVSSRIEAAEFTVSRVQVFEFPTLRVTSMDNPIGRRDSEFFPQVQVELSQKFPWPGKLRTRGEIAQQGLEFLQSEKITTYRELVLQSKKMYFQLLFNVIASEITKNNRSIVLRLIDGALVLYKTGRGGQEDILKLELELQELEEELLALESEYWGVKASMNALLNRPPREPIDDPEAKFFARVNFDESRLETIALSKRSELHGIEATIDEHRAMARLSRLGYFPDFTFSAMYQRHTKIPNDRALGISLVIDLPLWAGAREGREIKEAEGKAQAQEYVLENMKAQIRGRIHELLANIRVAEERIVLYAQGLIPKTIQTLAAGEAQYRVGKGSFVALLDTRRQLQNVEMEHARMQIMREIFLAELERAVGIPLGEIYPRSNGIVYCSNSDAVKVGW